MDNKDAAALRYGFLSLSRTGIFEKEKKKKQQQS